MTTVWEDEYRSFRKRNLGDKDFVSVWADGVHFNVRLEDDRLCTLVIIGVRQDGTKELVTVEDGVRKAGLRCSKRAACFGCGRKLPKRLQPKAKRMLRDIMWAESKQQAEEEMEAFKA